MRYFIKFSYNGKRYHGWQSQPNAVSVQQTLTQALSVLLNTEIALVGAGRTDSGVHARQMFAHFDVENNIDSKSLVQKINSYLPSDIAVFDFISVSDTAHARFDAIKRTYEYHIHTFKDVFLNEQSWYYHQTLHVEHMNDAAQLLMKYTDFQCFSKSHTDVNSYDCTITAAYWKIENKQLIFTISADRFLRNMVRAIVGTLVYVGLHKITISDFKAIIESKDRKNAGFSVPAQGLFLTKIEYEYLNSEN